MTFINRIHSHIRNSLSTRRGAFIRPDKVPVGLHKEYSRMIRIPLPQAENIPNPLHEVLKDRVSSSLCVTGRKFSLSELGTLLGDSLGMRDGVHRHYPSGGALYPVETYIIGNVAEGFPSGVFHYNPKAHALEFLWEVPSSFAMSNIVRSPDTPLSSQLVVFTSVWRRSSSKYGDLAYSHAHIEAGHMAQNISLVATALSIGTRPIAGYDDKVLTELLNLDENEEQPIYSILLYPPLKK